MIRAVGSICLPCLLCTAASFMSLSARGQAGAKARPGNPRAAAADHRLLERYEGHLASADEGFSLTLYHDGTASADWTRQSGSPLHYAGTYSGSDGNYRLKLTPKAEVSGAAEPLTLTTRGMGGMMTGQYAEGGGALRAVSSLRLMEVDSGGVKLKPSRAAGARSAHSSRAPRGRSARRTNSGSYRAAKSAVARARRALNRAGRSSGRRINP